MQKICGEERRKPSGAEDGAHSKQDLDEIPRDLGIIPRDLGIIVV
jgi:hypothetical protein